jgi:hypothetical protein
MAKYQFTTPLIVRGGEAVRLHRIPFSEKTFDESWLQELLFNHPALIPFHDLEPIFSDSFPLVRELPTAAGPLDLLYMNSKGFLTLVETKLWRNPEARRSVVAQLIDYAKEMAFWSYEDLLKALRKAGMKSSSDPLIDLFREMEGEEFDDRRFIDQVSSNLRQGRSLLLIIGDGIQEGVEHMVSFLQQTPQLGFNLALVEIGLFREHPENDELLFVQPRILARTREITRAIVEIKVPLKLSDIEITLPFETEQKKSKRIRITEEEFFNQLKNSSGAEGVEFARWVLDNAEDHNLQIDWGESGPMVKYADPSTGKLFTFIQVRSDGRFVINRLSERFEELGLPLEICRDYIDEVVQWVPGASRRRFTTKTGKWEIEQIVYGDNPSRWDYPPIAKLAPYKEQFMELIDKAINRIREFLENG